MVSYGFIVVKSPLNADGGTTPAELQRAVATNGADVWSSPSREARQTRRLVSWWPRSAAECLENAYFFYNNTADLGSI